mmetsp:Transcript_35509/g.48521  ORF Transcript_35509/g.48521 Transcript_35509/m.48521 type:complete len:207 (+) Transcript_35509:191-811(+)
MKNQIASTSKSVAKKLQCIVPIVKCLFVTFATLSLTQQTFLLNITSARNERERERRGDNLFFFFFKDRSNQWKFDNQSGSLQKEHPNPRIVESHGGQLVASLDALPLHQTLLLALPLVDKKGEEVQKKGQDNLVDDHHHHHHHRHVVVGKDDFEKVASLRHKEEMEEGPLHQVEEDQIDLVDALDSFCVLSQTLDFFPHHHLLLHV